MGKLSPISHRELINKLHKLGFEGTYPGGRHPLMRRANVTVVIPNPHKGDISVDLLSRILRLAGVSREEWESVK